MLKVIKRFTHKKKFLVLAAVVGVILAGYLRYEESVVRWNSPFYRWMATTENAEEVGAALRKASNLVNKRDGFHRTLLFVLASIGKFRLIETLLELPDVKEINYINATTDNGMTALSIAVCRNHSEVVSLLLKHGGNPNATDSFGMTSLHWAAMYGFTEISNLLLKYGAGINGRDSIGMMPLHLAARHGWDKCATLLIDFEAGAETADINGHDGFGMTPLHWAAMNNRKIVLNLFLNSPKTKHLLEINAKDTNLWTPLHVSAFAGNVEIVSQLLKRGADKTLKNVRGKTPRDLAEEKKHKKVVKIFGNEKDTFHLK